MGDKTGISWTNATWNPLRGCSRVSEGCRNCYAEVMAARFSGPGQPYEGLARTVGGDARWTGEVQLIEEHLSDPLRWKKPRMIFVNSMSDLFHEKVPDLWIDMIFRVMARATQHTFQVLTKRPERMRDYMLALGSNVVAYGREANRLPIINDAPPPWPLPNVWLGVSVEDQAAADARIPPLLETPAAVRFVSAEPLLGSVSLARWLSEKDRCECERGDYGTAPTCGSCPDVGRVYVDGAYDEEMPETCWTRMVKLDWVIAGGESGGGYREMDMADFRQLHDQCKAAGVPFFAKQDSALLSGKQGRIKPEMWVQEWPAAAAR